MWRRLTTALVAVGLGLGVYPTKAAAPAHPTDTIDHMRRIDVAAIHGDFPRLREAASWVVEHVGAVDGAGGVKDAAWALARAADVTAAASGAARLASACGQCHQASRVTPAVPRASPPAGDTIASHMVRHQAAADLLREGLIVPSDAAWRDGARQLREAPLRPGEFPVSNRIGALMADLEQRMHALARNAESASGPTRTDAYAALLGACAACHTRHTTLWESPKH